MSRPQLNRSLALSIILYALAFALPLSATAALGLWLYGKQSDQVEQSYKDLLQSIFQEKVDNDFQNHKQALRLMSFNSDLQKMNWKELEPWVKWMTTSPDFPFEKIVIAMPTGKYWTQKPGNPAQGNLQTEDNKDPKSKPLSLYSREYWQLHLKGKSAHCFVSEPIISKSNKAKQWVIGCPLFLPDSNGMIAGTLDWKLFYHKISEIKNQLELNHGLHTHISIINKENRFVFSEDSSQMLHMAPDGTIIPGQLYQSLKSTPNHTLPWNSQDSIHFQIPIPGIYSTAIVSVSRSELLGPLRAQLFFALIAIAIATGLGLLFHALNLIRSRKNLNKLYQASYQLMCGQLPLLNHHEFPRGEWRTVAHAFQNTANQLLEREQELIQHKNDLEDEVERRTKIALESRAESDRLQVILEQIPVSVVITDTKEKIVFANDYFCTSTGYDKAFILGKTPRILKSGLHPKELYLQMWKTLCQGQIWRGILRNRRKNGDFIWVQTTILPYFDNDQTLTHYVAVHEDISELKQQEEALRRTTLEAQIAAETKAEFLSVMSHEIRTPLNGVVGFAQILQMEDHLPEQVDSLRSLERSARHLLGLVNDILDFSKIEAGKLELHSETTNIHQLCKDALYMFHSHAEEKGIELQLSIEDKVPEWFSADPLRLGQVLINLLSNAVKFTTKGGVYLKVQCLQDHSDFCILHFTIQDTGIGISPDQVERLFQPFAQAHSGIARKFGGSGLGLVISQKIIEMQNSKLQLYSEPGQGSTFFFKLQLPKCQAPQHAQNPTKSLQKWPGIKVLLVDDNTINLKVGKKFLEMWDLDVFTASSGSEALAKVQEEHFEIILMDLQMPEMDGYQSARQILKIRPTQTIYALSAEVGEDLHEKLRDYGMLGLIPKPFRPEFLHDRLAQHLNQIETSS